VELSPREERDQRVQDAYARWLDVLSKIAFALSIAALAVYLSGVVAPYVPVARVAALWGQPVARYLAESGAPVGWGWISLVAYGDYLNLVCIAWIASVSIACYLRILPALLAGADRLYAVIAAAQIAVLLLAASGLLNSIGGR